MKHLLPTALLVMSLVAALPSADAPLHFGLSRSVPGADSVVAPPAEIRLWFTEEPQGATTTIRLLEAEGAGVHVTDAQQDPEEPRSFFVALHGELPPGRYTVSWRGMGSDGHVVRDTFQFEVAAP